MKTIIVIAIFLVFTLGVAAAADFCLQDVMQCPDGSYSSRDPANNCEFAPCTDRCANVICASPPPAYCSGGRLLAYNPTGACSLGECSYPKSFQDCEYGCSSGSCNPAPQSSATASEHSSSSQSELNTAGIEASFQTSQRSSPPEPEPEEQRNISAGAGGYGNSDSFVVVSSGFAGGGAQMTDQTEIEQQVESGHPEEKQLMPAVQASSPAGNVVIEKKENVTVLVSGGARAETTEPVVTAGDRIFIRNETPASEIKILPDEARERAKKSGASVITSMKIEMKEAAIYSIRGYSERRLFGILPVRVDYEVSLNAKNSVQKVSLPWWGVFAV